MGDADAVGARRGFIASVCAELQQHGFESEAIELKNNLHQCYRRLAELNAKLGRPYNSDASEFATMAPVADMRTLVQEASTESRRLRSELAELEAQVRRYNRESTGREELHWSVLQDSRNPTTSPSRYGDLPVVSDILNSRSSNGLLYAGQMKMSPSSYEVSTSLNMSGSPSMWTPSTTSPLSAAAHTVNRGP